MHCWWLKSHHLDKWTKVLTLSCWWQISGVEVTSQIHGFYMTDEIPIRRWWSCNSLGRMYMESLCYVVEIYMSLTRVTYFQNLSHHFKKLFGTFSKNRDAIWNTKMYPMIDPACKRLARRAFHRVWRTHSVFQITRFQCHSKFIERTEICNFRAGKRRDLSEFDREQVVGARKARCFISGPSSN